MLDDQLSVSPPPPVPFAPLEEAPPEPPISAPPSASESEQAMTKVSKNRARETVRRRIASFGHGPVVGVAPKSDSADRPEQLAALGVEHLEPLAEPDVEA